MKKLFVAGIFAALLLASCNTGTPAEAVISATDVETTGTGFNIFAPAAEVKAYAVQTPSGNWAVRATVPLQKVTDDVVEALSTSLDLLDRSGMRLNAAFDLYGQDITSILPVLNDPSKPIRNVVYLSSSEMDKKTANAAVANAVAGQLRRDAVIAAPVEEAQVDKPKPEFPYDPSVQDLVSYYGVRGILRQYESAYRNGNKDRCKQLKARLSKIEDQINDHPRGGRKISNAFEDWCDDRIDEIEDRVDDGKKRRR